MFKEQLLLPLENHQVMCTLMMMKAQPEAFISHKDSNSFFFSEKR